MGAAHGIDPTGACTLEQQNKNVAINDDGRVAVVWKTITPTGGDPITGWTHNVLADDGGWGTATFSGNYPFQAWPNKPGIAIDPSGNVVLAFRIFSSDYVLATRRFTASTQSWGTLAYGDPYSANFWPQVHALADGIIMTVGSAYNFGNGRSSVFARRSDFSGGVTEPGLSFELPNTPTDISVSPRNGRWVTFRTSTFVGISGVNNAGWETYSSFVNDANAVDPLITGTEPDANGERALLVYQRLGELRYAVIRQQMFGGGFDSATVRTIPSGSFSAHDVRLEYDIPGRHGILVWLTDDPSNVRIFATDYHILPPMVP
ncbi:MAG: hypothetical protein KC668_24190 [Myxococcales bacterium]|nr:hypothetical protein [Myxococcales bacterium]